MAFADDRMRERKGIAGGLPARSRKKRMAALEPRKQPRQQRSSQMVDRILDAALVLTREQGTRTPTTLAIARRAGLSVGSIYQYYPNKEAILLDLARRWLAAFPEVIQRRIDAPRPGLGSAVAAAEAERRLAGLGQHTRQQQRGRRLASTAEGEVANADHRHAGARALARHAARSDRAVTESEW